MSGRDRPSKDRVERFVRDFVVLWSEHVRLDSAGNTARVRTLWELSPGVAAATPTPLELVGESRR